MERYDEIVNKFRENADPENAVHMEAYMRNRFRFFGIKTPLRKEISKGFIKEEKKKGYIDWELCDRLFDNEYRELNYLALDIIDTLKKQLTFEDTCRLFEYSKKRQWWDTIDRLDRLTGDIGLKDDRIKDLMLMYSKDNDFWIRRLAIDHQLGRKTRTDKELLKEIILNNLGSDEFFINKAIGWSLREYSKTDKVWVREFIDEYRDRLSNLSIREASRYI